MICVSKLGAFSFPEIASAHAHCDETHIIRFVSTSRTRIRQLRHRLVEMCSRYRSFSTAHAQ